MASSLNSVAAITDTAPDNAVVDIPINTNSKDTDVRDDYIPPSIDTMIPTLRFMIHRKLRRKAHGQYRRHSTRRYIFSAVVIALFMTLVGIGAQKLELATSWPELGLIVILLLVMIYIVVKVSIIIRWCFYWLVLATLVLFAINRGQLFDRNGTTNAPDDKISLHAKIVVIVLAFLEGATLSVVFFLRVAYPRIVLRATWLNSRSWWRIKETPLPMSKSVNYRTTMFSYVSWDPDEYRLSRSSVSYVGEFDDQGRPHGLGEWTDHTFTGEALQGIWEHGVPIGPFKSQEYGTGNAFCNIRIGFCKNSIDKNDSTAFKAARDPNGPSYGAAAVECSVSGKFFHHLPYVRIIGDGVLRSELEQKAKDDLEAPSILLSYPLSFLSTFAESLQSRPSIRGSFHGTLSPRSAPLSKSIVVRYTDRGIFIPGYIMSRRRTNVNEVMIRRICPPHLGLEGEHLGHGNVHDPTPGNSKTTPVPTLLLPSRQGGSSSASVASDDSDSGVDRLGIQRISFSGSTGSDQSRSVEKARKRRLTQAGLVVDGWRQVLDIDGRSSSAVAASRAGYEALVFVHGYNCALTYGIGRLGQLLALGEFPPYIKPFVFSWPSSTTMGYFTAKSVGCSDNVANDLRQFIIDLKEAGFRRVHILAHSMGARIVLSALRKSYFDGVLAEREVVDPEPSIISNEGSKTHLQGRMSVKYRDRPQQRTKSGHSLTEEEDVGIIQLATFTLLNPDADLDIFLEEDYWTLSKYCPHITLYADAHDGALFWSEVLGRKKSLGRHPRTLVYSPTGEVLDVDVIDTTSLDVNIHSIRHNFFNLNRMLVDDLYDVVVLGRRATEREARLSSRWTFADDGTENGEVYTFLCAPSYVVNK
ncbi:hypothetical protein BG015_003879 [Linnemannia schmuckeri]|uniref:Alpha/beta-hydrolase n=1 Tax=Linnemannia schmuckeri TaxID=64567 RepID=A0A9P5S6Y5_9FUNG|nr:hypothetical protein BG015_003879 [Linnemannia schmuckeri]